ncbi:MAG: reductive dehalogenase [Candidatus Promineifilaceae bacterium]
MSILKRWIFRKNRPIHLGKYPMEMIKRVDQTTTHISDDVPRMPKRANFFVRSARGDLGARQQKELRRFVGKMPLNNAFGRVMRAITPLQRNTAKEESADLPDDPADRSKHLKSLCTFLDADIVGICEVPEYAWYSHNLDGSTIEAKHKYAIVMLIDQGYETMAGSSGDDWISASQSYHAYLRGAEVATVVSGYLNELGYEAQAHTNSDSDVLHIPLIMLAGLGELSRIGEVVLNPFLGPRFKTSIVTTNLELAVDKPIDFNLQSFCNSCMKCARECPCGAISFGDKIMFNGYEMWKPDVEACTRYRVSNPAGSGCGRCMKVCHFNKQGLMQHRVALWLAINVPASHKLLIWLDDALDYGQRVADWKWWIDLEWVDGRLVRPKKTNKRNLRPERSAPTKTKNVTFYGINEAPPPAAKEAVPIRKRKTRKKKQPPQS